MNAEVFENSKQWDPFLNLDDPYSRESVEGYKKSPTNKDGFYVIAEIDGTPIGYLVGSKSNYSYRSNTRGEINHMGISPKYRNQGMGSKLIYEFKKWCLAHGITHIATSTYYNDEKARHFYEKNGLKPIDITLEGEI